MGKLSVEAINAFLKQKGILQKEIAEELGYDPSYLSIILSGKRNMPQNIFEYIMARIGLNPKNYSGAATAEDIIAIDLSSELKFLLRQNNKENIEKAEEIIAKLERTSYFSGVARQVLLGHKATIANHREQYEKMLNYTLEGLGITKSSSCKECGDTVFDEDKIETYDLTLQEIKLVNQLAVARANIECEESQKTPLERSSDVLEKLEKSMKVNPYHDEDKAVIHMITLYNLTKSLALQKKCEKGIQLCDEGIELAKRFRNSHFEPLFMFNKAYMLLYLGQKQDGESLLRKTYAIFDATGRHNELNIAKEFINKEFDEYNDMN